MVILALEERIRHLVRRAGFGAPPIEVRRLAQMGFEAAVEDLLRSPAAPEPVDPPALGKQPYDAEKLIDIQAYWLHRIAVTKYPLVEKMTLFWHGHFATGASKARPPLMQGQNELLRRHALGSFPGLLRDITKDAAMLVWLDGNGSNRRAPNENYARESMELFTIGPGPYTEHDVKESARALTGWHVDRLTSAVEFRPAAFDKGVKTFLGQTGSFGADDIADILSARPEVGTFLATKLWKFFASAQPDPTVVAEMARAYQQSRGDIKSVLRTLFLSDGFYAQNVVGGLVKSPAELVGGSLRLFGFTGTREAAALCSRMGQVLFDPPNVAGWPGGNAWLGSSTLLTRWNFGEGVKLLLGQKPRQEMPDTAAPGAMVDAWLERLCVQPVSADTRKALLSLFGPSVPADKAQRWELTRNLVRTIVASPEYQTA